MTWMPAEHGAYDAEGLGTTHWLHTWGDGVAEEVVDATQPPHNGLGLFEHVVDDDEPGWGELLALAPPYGETDAVG